MSSTVFNIYLIGVGGQGIGLLSEAMMRAADHAGLETVGVDTHGLAQRGGMVVSHLRIGPGAHSPLVPPGEADLVVALELHEAFRALNSHLKDAGTLLFYDVALQPLPVRLKKERPASKAKLLEECTRRGVKVFEARDDALPDSRMQNIVLLAEIARQGLVPGVEREHYEKALSDLLSGKNLELNLELFRSRA